jgi:hypothetical protein
MTHIVYTRVPTKKHGVKIVNNLGSVTHFGDFYAWGVFLEGAARNRAQGVDVTVIGETGEVLIGKQPVPVPYRFNEGQSSKERGAIL